MAGGRSYTDADLARAVAGSRSWRGVLRELGLAATSASAMRSVRLHAERLGLDHTHFTGQRRWSDDQLADAVRSSRSWAAVADRLGLRGGSSTTLLKGHAARLELDTTHLSRSAHRPSAPPTSAVPHPARLPRAGTSLAAGWLTLCGYGVSWPLEPTVYDLVVSHGHGFERVQVKTTTVRTGTTWVARLTRSSRSHESLTSTRSTPSRSSTATCACT